MGYLSPQSLYSRDLARRRIWLRPPEPGADLLMAPPGEGIYLGRSKLMAVPVYWDFHRLANPHVAVVGMTGSGKSYFVKTFITRAWRQWGTSSLILDWAGEYTPWVQQVGGHVVKLGRGQGLNVLDCRPALQRAKWLDDEENEGNGGNQTKPGKKTKKAALAPFEADPYSSTPRFRIEQLISSFKTGTMDGSKLSQN